jgi:hypothetical protein
MRTALEKAALIWDKLFVLADLQKPVIPTRDVEEQQQKYKIFP